ncbi:hypothetical protein M0R45_019733 [Rubus argutus]|uniref:DUF1664 domain-containing protein n=1 Tax=Rubus argutus TaxID=59490 RepID=A0AAW1X694_RUBAR
MFSGWKLPDMMFATRRSLADAGKLKSFSKQIDSIFSSISVTKWQLSSNLDGVDRSLAESIETTARTQQAVGSQFTTFTTKAAPPLPSIAPQDRHLQTSQPSQYQSQYLQNSSRPHPKSNPCNAVLSLASPYQPCLNHQYLRITTAPEPNTAHMPSIAPSDAAASSPSPYTPQSSAAAAAAILCKEKSRARAGCEKKK